jgi:hypothetical protein
MPLIDIGLRRITLSRVPSIGEHIILPEGGEQLVTRVAHLPEQSAKGVRAVVTLVPVRAEDSVPETGDIQLILRRRG